jgi:hypothetical protein
MANSPSPSGVGTAVQCLLNDRHVKAEMVLPSLQRIHLVGSNRRQALCEGTRRHLADCEPSILKDACTDSKVEIWFTRGCRLKADYRAIVEIKQALEHTHSTV